MMGIEKTVDDSGIRRMEKRRGIEKKGIRNKIRGIEKTVDD